MATNLPTNIVAGQEGHAALHNGVNAAVNIVDGRVSSIETELTTGRLSPNSLSSTIDQSVTDALGNQGSQVVAWNNIADKPITFPPSPHSTEISEVSGLQTILTALDSKIVVLLPGQPIPDVSAIPEGALVVQLRS